MTFDSFNFHPHIAAGISRLGYETPTPIQEKAIGPVLAGRDVMGLAETGTGKTAAFVLPVSQRLLQKGWGKVRCLVLAPTRELAQQTHEVLKTLGEGTGLRSLALYGGVGYEPQLRGLQRGVDFLVACPGRLLDHVGRRTVDLSSVEVVVLDEADRMLDMGFLPDIRRILELLPRERQSLLFTATMPAEIERLARDFMNRPEVIRVGRQAPVRGVSHALYPVMQSLKADLLIATSEEEAARNLIYLRDGGKVIRDSRAGGPYDIDARGIAYELDHPRGANLVLLGFAIGELEGLKPGPFEEVITELSPSRWTQKNLEAFRRGLLHRGPKG